MLRAVLVFIQFVFIISVCPAQKVQSFEPGKEWKDTNGNPINAHGGGILYYNNTWYWYGEIKKGKTWLVPGSNWEDYRVDAGGVSCYSSKDLMNWKYEGVVLTPNTTDSTNDLHISKVIERPKVIYNKHTRKFVMWMHIDAADYSYARSGVAVSDKPTGPFKYIRSERPNGNMARDMTIFQDDDGKAYHFYSSEENATMHVCLLTDDYLGHTAIEKRIFINQSREAPAVFKSHNRYYIITSGCTGWSPNTALYAVADSVLGNWTSPGTPCIGEGAKQTWQSQSTYVIPVNGIPDTYIFMADRWNKTDLEQSRYVWLPLTINSKGEPEIRWRSKWNLRKIE
jgi:beta-xylosidase